MPPSARECGFDLQLEVESPNDLPRIQFSEVCTKAVSFTSVPAINSTNVGQLNQTKIFTHKIRLNI